MCDREEEALLKKLFCHAVVYASTSTGDGRGVDQTEGSTDATEYNILPDGAVRVVNGKIVEIIADTNGLTNTDRVGYEIVDLEGMTLVPGFVDLHVHGGGGYDVMQGEAEQVQEVSVFHAKHGTTAMLATTWTADRHSIDRAVSAITEAIEQGTEGADIVGIHLEGPFIHPVRCGAQHPAHIREPSIEELASYIDRSHNRIRLMTIAPEQPRALEVIRYAVQHDICVSIGHSEATADQIREAVKLGASHVTHLFNGMRPLHHREPGVAGSALMLDELTVELICDGHHVHRDIIDLVFRVKRPGQIVLITDAVAAAGMPDGDGYHLAGQVCYKQDGQVRLLSDNSLAGSCLTMDEALHRTLRYTGRKLEGILPTMTSNPARQAGMHRYKGSIANGWDADFVVLDQQLEVAATYVRGRCVYTRP